MDAKIIEIKTTTSRAVRAFVGHVAKRVAQRDSAYIMSGVDDDVEVYLDFFKVVFSDVFNTEYTSTHKFDQSMVNDTYRAVYTALPDTSKEGVKDTLLEEGVVLLSNFVLGKATNKMVH